MRCLIDADEKMAKKYFYLASAMDDKICEDKIWQQLFEYWNSDKKMREVILRNLKGYSNLSTRTVSYDPPEGSIPI